MNLTSGLASLVALMSVVACTVTNTHGDGSSGSSGAPAPASGDGGSSGNPASAGDSGTSATAAPPSATAANVDIAGSCAAFTACGGNPQGTYDYTAGCVANTFAAAKTQCPALDTSNARVSVTGSLYFVGAALERNANVKVSGSITVPESCSAGQCADVEAALKSSFDTITCTGSAACTCAITKTTSVKNATTFAVSGNSVTTDDGESYEICAQTNALRYSGKSLGSESGSWELVKRP